MIETSERYLIKVMESELNLMMVEGWMDTPSPLQRMKAKVEAGIGDALEKHRIPVQEQGANLRVMEPGPIAEGLQHLDVAFDPLIWRAHWVQRKADR